MVCRWAMPYRKNARVTLVNLAAQAIKASLCVTVGPWTWDDQSMHFHAAWHYEAGLKTPPAPRLEFRHLDRARRLCR